MEVTFARGSIPSKLLFILSDHTPKSILLKGLFSIACKLRHMVCFVLLTLNEKPPT